jgi:transcriptional regulator with XRE-family HTH domain
MYFAKAPVMAIQFRSTPKHTPRDRTVDAILSKEDFEDAVAAVNMTLADIAKQTKVNRQYLSEFKCGDRNLRAEMRQTLRDFFEAKGVEFVTAEPDDDDGEDESPVETFPTRKAVDGFAVLPTPTFAIGIAPDLPAADRTAALRELDAIVRENDRQLALTAAYEDSLFFDPTLSDGAKAVNEELRQGLAYEAILRRVLAGSFKARYAEGQAATHADLIAQQLLGHLPEAGLTDPDPLANSSDENSVADAASAGAARGEGPSAARAKATVFG